MEYLIVKCVEDDYEIYKTPLCITKDWKNNLPKQDFFEVWEILPDKSLKCIKEWDEAIEEGMVFGYYDEKNDPDHDNFITIKKFEGYTRDNKVPKNIKKELQSYEDYEDMLNNCGFITAWTAEKMYMYGEYADNYISKGF